MSKVTFYAYLPDGSLRRNKFQTDYPKYETIPGRSRQEDRHVTKYPPIIFEKGVYETDNEDIIEYLRMYNTGGTFKKEKDFYGNPLTIQGDRILAIIKESAPSLVNTVIKTETVTKEVNKISRDFLPALDIKTLQAYCVTYNITMPQDKTRESLINAMEVAGYIHD